MTPARVERWVSTLRSQTCLFALLLRSAPLTAAPLTQIPREGKNEALSYSFILSLTFIIINNLFYLYFTDTVDYPLHAHWNPLIHLPSPLKLMERFYAFMLAWFVFWLVRLKVKCANCEIETRHIVLVKWIEICAIDQHFNVSYLNYTQYSTAINF